MMELWVNSSKDEISVNAKYNAENAKECNEVSNKIQQCISWWNCNNSIWAHSAGNGTDKRGITINEDGITFSGPDIGIKQEKSDTDPLTDYERSRAALYKRLRTALYGTKNETSS